MPFIADEPYVKSPHMRAFKEKKRVNFLDLFESKSKDYVVVTFLAVLEMCKNNEIRLSQNDRFGEIICEVYNG